VKSELKFGKRDIALLQSLRGNARLSLTQMSRKTKIPISTLFDKLKVHEKKIIKKYTSIIDFSSLGYSTKVQFLIKSPYELKHKLRSYLHELDEINTVFGITNGYDFLAEGIFETVSQAHEFKSMLEENFSQVQCHSHFVVEDIKREGFFAS
jgi:DNA-binding Lrp family transcriptional regulator